MDCVYVCRDGDNEELRYSIRSVHQNMPHDNIWVVGGKPDWYTGNHIPVVQWMDKEANEKANLAAIATSDEISDPFILMNDDFFVVHKLEDFVMFNGGKLIDRVKLYSKNFPGTRYLELLLDLHKHLLMLGFDDPVDYETHTPIIMTKSILKATHRQLDLFRSVYGNAVDLDGIPISNSYNDVKYYINNPGNLQAYDIETLPYPYLSSDDESFSAIYEKVLLDMFPEPSPYEK